MPLGRSIELRKVKSLGGSKLFAILQPGQLSGNIMRPMRMIASEDGGEEDGDDDVEGTISTTLPPFEPLILWQDNDDSTNKIEVRNFRRPVPTRIIFASTSAPSTGNSRISL